MGKDDYKAARELLQKLSENNSDAELRQRAQDHAGTDGDKRRAIGAQSGL